jgi:hypothetical protein
MLVFLHGLMLSLGKLRCTINYANADDKENAYQARGQC